MSIQELPENRSGAIDPRLEIAYNSNYRVTIERAALHSADEHNVKWSGKSENLNRVFRAVDDRPVLQ